MKSAFLKNYSFSVFLLSSIAAGFVLGLIFKKDALMFKPLGDIFLNLLFTAVVPLVFFSISSAVCSMGDLKRLGRIMGWMIAIFMLTGLISALVMVAGVTLYPPSRGVVLPMMEGAAFEPLKVSDQIVKAFTVPDFTDLLSKKNMLALIVFSLLTGLASSLVGAPGKAFREFLLAGYEVMGKLIALIMIYAPVGLGAYFAYLTGVFGPELFGSYVRAMTLYYPVTIAYYFAAFTLYAYLAAGPAGVRRFWLYIVPASLTALATGSSVAAIPTNLAAAQNIGIPKDIREVVIPIGATIHMEGSCLSAILKIAFLFGIYNMDFTGVGTIASAIGVAILSGTVMSGIPGGGFLGELLIITMYGFPVEAMPIISMIGVLVDPPATMVNSTGDTSSSMLISRIMGGRRWMESTKPSTGVL